MGDPLAGAVRRDRTDPSGVLGGTDTVQQTRRLDIRGVGGHCFTADLILRERTRLHHALRPVPDCADCQSLPFGTRQPAGLVPVGVDYRFGVLHHSDHALRRWDRGALAVIVFIGGQAATRIQKALHGSCRHRRPDDAVVLAGNDRFRLEAPFRQQLRPPADLFLPGRTPPRERCTDREVYDGGLVRTAAVDSLGRFRRGAGLSPP